MRPGTSLRSEAVRAGADRRVVEPVVMCAALAYGISCACSAR
jgi:hypothetical protein